MRREEKGKRTFQGKGRMRRDVQRERRVPTLAEQQGLGKQGEYEEIGPQHESSKMRQRPSDSQRKEPEKRGKLNLQEKEGSLKDLKRWCPEWINSDREITHQVNKRGWVLKG